MQTSMESQDLPNDSLELLNYDYIAALKLYLPSTSQLVCNVFLFSLKHNAEAVLVFLGTGKILR